MPSWGRGVRLALIAWGLLVGTACLRDTCGDGDAVTDPVIEGRDARFVMTWSQGTGVGAELGDDYFAEASLAEDGDPAVATLSGLTYVPPRRFEAGLSVVADGASLVRIELPDRMGPTRCTHPGMSDAWFLTLTLTVAGGAVVEAGLDEGRSFGAL